MEKDNSQTLSTSPESAPFAPRRRFIGLVTGAAVTLFWLVMMFSLVSEHILPERRAKALAAQSVEPSKLVEKWHDLQEWMLVTFHNRRVGAVATTITRLPGQAGGFRADLAFSFSLNLLEVSNHITMNGAAELDPAFNLNRFHLWADLTAMKWSVTGAVDGDYLLVEVLRGSAAPNRMKFRLDRPLSFLEAVRPLAARSFEIRPGSSIVIPVADPVWSMQLGMLEMTVRDKETITLGQKQVEAYKVESRLNDFVSTSWVNEKGETLRRQLAGGLVLDRASYEQVQATGNLPKEKVQIPRLDTKAFAKIDPQPLSRIGDRKSSPLSILGSFVR